MGSARRPRRITTACQIAVCALAACTGERSYPAPVLGICESIQKLTLDGPVFVIAPAEDSPSHLVSVTAAVRTPNGRIIVLDSAQATIRVFDDAGHYIGSAGRRGFGPGELQMPRLLQSLGDSVVIHDPLTHKLMVVGDDGRIARELTLETAELIATWLPEGVLPSGAIVARRPIRTVSQEPKKSWTVDADVAILDPDGSVKAMVGRFPDARWYSQPFRGTVARGPQFFTWRLHVAVGADKFFVGVGNALHVNVFDLAGRPIGSIAGSYQPRLVDDRVKALFRSWIGNAPAGTPPAPPEVFARERFADTIPAFGRILPSQDGSFWLVDYGRYGVTATKAVVFEPAGTCMREVELPQGFLPTDVGADYAIGVGHDSLDVQRVELYRLSLRHTDKP